MKKKQIANYITSLRIIGTFSLLFTKVFSVPFYIIYTLCGITDILDGLVARLTKSTSEFGAKLDSIADLLFYIVMVKMAFPMLIEEVPAWIWTIAVASVAVRVASYATAAIKYRRFASLHTYMNKITGVVVFSIPYFVKVGGLVPACAVICIVALIAGTEELIIHIHQKKYRPVKSILKVR